jgi:predicted nuclease of predicted toxin-antitoxin system
MGQMKVKLDEALSDSLVSPLRERGHDAQTVREQGWGGLKDSALWPLVTGAAEFFITADKGLGDLRHYPPGTHSGILVLRPDRESLVQYRILLEIVLRKHRLETLVGLTTVATSRGIRVRRATR